MVTRAPLRIVFFGTPDFAVPTLEQLHGSRHPIVGVVTQPDRARGRGHKAHAGPVKQFALDRKLQILQPERLRDEQFLRSLQALDTDLGVVAAYGRILTDSVLSAPRLGLVNVHASLLPKYRGAAPIHRAILAGESETGVSIMRVVKALDAGPVLATARRTIHRHETSSDVERDLAATGAQILVEVLDAIADGRATETPQDESLATYASKLEKIDGVIDWSRSAVEIHNQIRGLHPWPHAFSEIAGERTILLTSDVEIDTGPSAHEPGVIVEAHGDRFLVQTGGGILRLLTLQPEGRRPMSAREYLAGHRIEPGTRFISSQTA
jgi:methionyl-tRNA formyltransferase